MAEVEPQAEGESVKVGDGPVVNPAAVPPALTLQTV